MTTSTPSSTLYPPHDLPIIVEDRRRRGFYTVDNDIVDQYGPQLKAYGVAVYNVLSRFANREGQCFPSQATIAKRLGMSRMQVSREIGKLQQLHLIEVHPQYGPQGEQRANLYILLDVSKEEEAVTHRYAPRHGQLHPPVTGSDTPCHRRLHKQNPKNKTQSEQNPEEQQAVVVLASPDKALDSQEAIHKNLNEQMDAPEPSPVLEPVPIDIARANPHENSLSAVQQTSAAALIAIGLAETVAHQLAEHYSPAYIAEKIEYLAYLQAEHPAQVLKPCGWLRRAIEQNYAAPDGYQSADKRASDAVERQRHAAETQRLAQEQLYEQEVEQKRRQQAAADRLTYLYTTYGTTQRELELWQLLLQEFQRTMPATSFTLYVADTVLLSLNDGEALIGMPTLLARDWLENRFTAKIRRALASYLEGQKVSVKFIDLNPPEHEGSLGGLRCGCNSLGAAG
jgi:hypothetical protein